MSERRAERGDAGLGATVLNRWHREHGARMVGFGGFEMPLHYAGGILAEHLATRRHAGLFDISHMGRFRLEGPGAEGFLLRALTNNARALAPGEAQYTLIADEEGGAVDDAYLYRLGPEAFLLVVNAANRAKDWAWLEALRERFAAAQTCRMEDASEPLAMISLQGPGSADVLERLVPARALPENKRNRVAVVEHAGAPLVVARTGYTGETVCFELFPGREAAGALWTALVEGGATPAGLGARDSLRLEAGLPLYGHELGTDPEGAPIPVFANALASFAVRVEAREDYVGRAALERQRAELERIRRGELETPLAERALPRLVQPVAVFGGRRPLRAGHTLALEGRAVGYVTSGTVVPVPEFYGKGITAVPSEDYEVRPIGLALVDSDIAFRADRPVVFDVRDGRGRSQPAELVQRNLWPGAPYARAAAGFVPPAPPPTAAAGGYAERVRGLRAEAAANTAWRRTECINLIPSEQAPSALVDALCTADPAGRYNEHNKLRALGPDAPDVRYYKGTAFIMDREVELKAALRAFFGCKRVEPRPISGQMANDVVYDALKQFRNRFRRGREPRALAPVLVHDLNKGGHLSAQVTGALKNYVGFDPDTERAAVLHFPSDPAEPHRVDVAATQALIAEQAPDLVVFGRSVILHREPVAEIAAFVWERFGRDNPSRPLLLYDGAHVLGLLGEAFQAPLAEGADVVTGSTHKTFFGPQRGVILSDIAPGSAFEPLWELIERRAFPGHVSNHHLGTLLGLLGATYEMLAFRDEYPARVVANARAFAAALAAAGLRLEGDPAAGYTETHQVLIRLPRGHGERQASALEASNVITNPQALPDDPSFAAASGIRMGTQEMTRYGMGPEDFETLAGIVARILRDGAREPAGRWAEEVKALRARFTTMRYCL